MLTLGMTAGDNKDAILVIKIDLDTEIMYFSTREDKLTLDGTDFDGKVIGWTEGDGGKVSTIEKLMNVVSGGDIGSVGNFSFELARYTSYTNGTTTFDEFFNDFYPATGKPLLTSKAVEVGICWENATTLAEVTWFWYGYIEDYSWDDVSLYCGCIEYDELISVEVPYYTVQKELDNDISYYPNAPEESYGVTIPIVYGDFNMLDLEYSKYDLVPALRIHKEKFDYKVCSHIVKTTGTEKLYKYLDTLEIPMTLEGASSSETNTRAGHEVSLSSDGSMVTGDLIVQPRAFTRDMETQWDTAWGVLNPQLAIDDDDGTYATILSGGAAVYKLESDITTQQVGTLNRNNWDDSPANQDYVQFVVEFNVQVAQSATVSVRYWHPTMGVNSGYNSRLVASGSYSGNGNTINFNFGNGYGIDRDWAGEPRKYSSGVPWTIEEIQQLQFHIKNAGAGLVYITNCYFRFRNITVFQSKERKTGTAYIDFFTANEPNISWKTYYAKNQWIKLDKPINYFGRDDIYASVEGYMYDSWIDL